jgi:hypothetical protein
VHFSGILKNIFVVRHGYLFAVRQGPPRTAKAHSRHTYPRPKKHPATYLTRPHPNPMATPPSLAPSPAAAPSLPHRPRSRRHWPPSPSLSLPQVLPPPATLSLPQPTPISALILSLPQPPPSLTHSLGDSGRQRAWRMAMCAATYASRRSLPPSPSHRLPPWRRAPPRRCPPPQRCAPHGALIHGTRRRQSELLDAPDASPMARRPLSHCMLHRLPL